MVKTFLNSSNFLYKQKIFNLYDRHYFWLFGSIINCIFLGTYNYIYYHICTYFYKLNATQKLLFTCTFLCIQHQNSRELKQHKQKTQANFHYFHLWHNKWINYSSRPKNLNSPWHNSLIIINKCMHPKELGRRTMKEILDSFVRTRDKIANMDTKTVKRIK